VKPENRSIEASVGELLREQGLTLATAESCTGGLIGQRLTAISGSSDYYIGGVIAYSNAVKVAVLGVSEAMLANCGAVSDPVAEAMASGVLSHFDVDVALSTTGIAGPSGGTPEKPVGLVYIGLAVRNLPPVARAFHFEGNRDEVRMAASQAALEMLQRHLVISKNSD
jgi:PncC family amidohydrolase